MLNRKIGFTMLMEGFFGSDAFLEQLRCAASWDTFQNKKIPPATHSTATRLFCSGRSRMWSHTAELRLYLPEGRLTGSNEGSMCVFRPSASTLATWLSHMTVESAIVDRPGGKFDVPQSESA